MDLNSIDWDSLDTAYGPATEVPPLLEGLTAVPKDKAIEVLFELKNIVYHQGSLYTSTAPVIRYFLELVKNPALNYRTRLLDFVATIALQISQYRDLIQDDDRWDIYHRCDAQIRQGYDLYLALLDDPNSCFRMLAVALLTALVADHDRVLYELFLARLATERRGHVQAALLFGISAIAPPSSHVVSELKAFTEAKNDLVRYAATYNLCQLSGVVTDRYASLLAEIINNNDRFRELLRTPAESENDAFHPKLNTLYGDQPVLPDPSIDSAPFPWRDACSRFEAIRLLMQADNLDSPPITQTMIQLLVNDTNITFDSVSRPILETILKHDGQSTFDCNALSPRQITCLRAIYDNVYVWGNFNVNSPASFFERMGLPVNRKDWRPVLGIDDALPLSPEQVEAMMDKLVRRSIHMRSLRDVLTDNDYARVESMNWMHIATDAFIPYLGLFPNLCLLNISDSEITSAGLAQLPALDHLEVLVLWGIVLDERAVRILAALPSLHSLNVSRTGFKRDWLSHLFSVTRLKELWLSENGFVEDDIVELRRHLPGCRIRI